MVISTFLNSRQIRLNLFHFRRHRLRIEGLDFHAIFCYVRHFAII